MYKRQKLDSLAKLYLHVGYSIVLQELNYMKEAPVTAVWLDRYATYVTFCNGTNRLAMKI